MCTELERLNGELAAEGRHELRIRIGVNSGEVVTGDGATTLVTGDAVNTAKRLEEAAGPGEILIGAATRQLVSNATELEPAQPVTAKGKSNVVEAWRVLGTIAGAAPFARRLDAPLVGRTRELAFLRDELAAAERERTCRLVTVYGAAGVGKSRLAAELLAEARDRAAVLTGLCLARPELLDERPRWGGSSLALDPLTESESQQLLDELAVEWPLTADARAQITDSAEGNPLFLEQMVAMLSDRGAAPREVPPTIQALLATRLDGLKPIERAVLERASVVGKEFWRGAVAELSPEDERARVSPALLSLVRKELVRPEQSTFLGDDGFRFRHALIRDAAYAAMPKSARADLHERFAAWLEARRA